MLHGLAGQHTAHSFVTPMQAVQYLAFAPRLEHRQGASAAPLAFAHPHAEFSPAIQQRQQFLVHGVDIPPQGGQAGLRVRIRVCPRLARGYRPNSVLRRFLSAPPAPFVLSVPVHGCCLRPAYCS